MGNMRGMVMIGPFPEDTSVVKGGVQASRLGGFCISPRKGIAWLPA